MPSTFGRYLFSILAMPISLALLIAGCGAHSPEEGGDATPSEAATRAEANTAKADETTAEADETTAQADEATTRVSGFDLKVRFEGIIAFERVPDRANTTHLRAMVLNASLHGAKPRPSGPNPMGHRAAVVFHPSLLARGESCQLQEGYCVEDLHLPQSPEGNGHAVTWAIRDGACGSNLDLSGYDNLPLMEEFGTEWGVLSQRLRENIERPSHVVAHAAITSGTVSTVETAFEDSSGHRGPILRWRFGSGGSNPRAIAEELLLEDTCRGTGLELALTPYGNPGGARTFRLQPSGSEIAFRIVNLPPRDIPRDDRNRPRPTGTVGHFDWFYILSANHGVVTELPPIPALADEEGKRNLPPRGGWPVCALVEMEPGGS